VGTVPPVSGETPEPELEADELLAARRRKLDALRAAGVDPFPPSFGAVEDIATIRGRHAELEPGAETDDRVRVAGRIAARREAGKAAFVDIVDRTGRIQLLARVNVLGEEGFERLTSLDLGDIVGAEGDVIASRTGELSVSVESVAVLAKSLRPPPDKRHGLEDVETRYRRRELDLMSNPEVRERFLARARVIAAVRRTLDEAGFVEVETPVLVPLYGGALARPFTTHHNALDRDLYLRIATELYLKRLVVGGVERVYELGKDFRNEGVSYKHNPEFTMLEFYEAYADYEDVARRLESIVAAAAEAVPGYEGPSLKPPWRRVTLRDAILEQTGVDVLASREREALVAAIGEARLELGTEERTWPQLVDDLLSKYVEPKITDPTFIVDYPVELSPFAKAHRSEPGLTERWEAFVDGMEIANAFTELNDPDEQRRRFEAQQRHAESGDDEAQPYDETFVQALEQGMPPTGGCGLGIDRLTMLLTGQSSLREVVLFPAMRD
jgi:lysyl-tRNA synthetase class 2